MSKDNIPTLSKQSDNKLDRSGFLPGVAHYALDVADRGQSTVIALLGDARTELRTAVDHAIELAEKLSQSGLRFARKVTQRVDDAAAEGLTGAERVLAGTIKSARETTRAAQELATSATSSVTGHAQA
jgi:hypothetical protein